MALISKSTETTRLLIPETLPGIAGGEWVEISTVYTGAMRRRIMRRTISVQATNGVTPSIDFDLFAYRQALLEEVVKAWSEESPVTPEAIEGLHPDIVDWLCEQFDAAAGGRSEEEKKDSSLISTSSPLPESEPSLLSSVTS